MAITKIFWSGGSQAVRLPRDSRFNTDEARIRRHGMAIVIEPIARAWAWLDQVIAPVDDDFARDAAEQPAGQDRPGLDAIA